jgi:hypothetical protein
MQTLEQPQIGHFYKYYHSDYRNISLCFKKERDLWFFVESDDGGDPSSLWLNVIPIEEFVKAEFEEIRYNNSDFLFDCFWEGLKNLKENHRYYNAAIDFYELSKSDYLAIDNAVAIFRVANHIIDDAGGVKDNYQAYLQSPRWKQIRAIMLSNVGKCQLCGSKTNLEVHHNSYEHIGDEKAHLEDLIVLCHDCHRKFHSK